MRSFSRRSPCSHSWSMLTFNVKRSGATARSVSRGGTTSGAAAASRTATWRVLMPAACLINSRWRCGCSSGAADNGPGDSSANRSSRDDSGASEAVCSDSDGATTGTGTDAGRCVGGRSCGAGSSSDDGAAGMGAQEGAGNSEACPFNSGRGSRAPSCPAPGSCATPCLATGTTGAFIAAASPEHCSAGGASSGADRGPRCPCSPASPGAAGSPSWLVRPAES